jgi:hypothetical protein
MASTISAGTTSGTAIAITGDTTGNLAFQTNAGTYTQTMPNVTGTVMVSGNMPAFSAYLAGSSQSVSSGVYTKAILDTEDFDAGGCFNNTGSTVTLNGLSVPSYSFCPNVAGYYQVNINMRPAVGSGVITGFQLTIYKNGADFARLYELSLASGGGSFGPVAGSILMYLNGTGDYIGLYAAVSGTSPTFNNSGSPYTSRMQASLVRTA